MRHAINRRWAIPLLGFAFVFSLIPGIADAVEDTGAVQGVVTDADTGAAIENALVIAYLGHGGGDSGGGGGNHGFHARTDETGFYTIEGMRPGSYELKCGAEGYLHGEAEVAVESGQVATVDFALEPLAFGAVGGTVVDAATGDPIAGAHVKLHRNLKANTSGGLSWFFAVTAEDGTYLMEQVPAGEYIAEALAWGYFRSEPMEVSVTEGATATADFSLEPLAYGAVEGLVTDAATGDPIAEALVVLFRGQEGDAARSNEEHGGGFNSAFTDENGFYRIEEVEVGSYSVMAKASGYVKTETEVEVVEGQTTTLDLMLEPIAFGSVTGTLSDAVTGEGIADAPVMLFRAGNAPGGVRGGSHPGGWLHTRTGADGSFAFEEVLAGEYLLWAQAPGYAWMEPVSVTVLEGEPTVVEVVLEPLAFGGIEGVVVDSATGDPIANALIFGRRSWFGDSGQSLDHHGGFAGARTDENGAFVLEELIAGDWELMVFAFGYHRASLEVTVEANQITTVEILLDPR